jgi:hypothetical protein
VQFSEEAAQILGSEFKADMVLPMYFANGLVAGPADRRNEHLQLQLPPCRVLAEYESIVTSQCKETTMTASGLRSAILASHIGEGRCVVFGPHPEASGPKWHSALQVQFKHACHVLHSPEFTLVVIS